MGQSKRTWTADVIVEQFKRHDVAYRKVVERGALLYVAAMEIDLASIPHTDESVSLPTEKFCDPALRRPATWTIRAPQRA
jgi:hypothetical protein